MIPISLALSFEFVRIFLNYLINDRQPNIKLNSSDLCSNLGMVEYIITDKTGTLTENCLKFALCVVGAKLYVENTGFFASDSSDRIGSECNLNINDKVLNLYPGEIYSFTDLTNDLIYNQGDAVLVHFFYCIALCNLAFPEDDHFLAISNDDKIFAEAAARFGFNIIERDEDSCIIEAFGTDIMFYVLGTQAFASDNKKSRIVVKQRGSNDVYMYLKGSKTAMENIFNETNQIDDIENAIVEYRLLYLGYKKLNKREISEFMFEYSNAKLSLVNKEGRVESVFERFEKNAEFLGIVGLEDTITDKTRSAVSTLKQAGIKFWLLSGDSEESTISTALSSGIISRENKILKLIDLTSELDCLNYLENYAQEYIFPKFTPRKENYEPRHPPAIRLANSELDVSPAYSNDEVFQRISQRRATQQPVQRSKRRSSVHPFISKLSLYKHLTSMQGEFNPKDLNFVISVDSRGLEFCLETSINLKYFIFLLFTAKAVCFHSLLPDQKSKVVRLVKGNFRFNPLVLSIGDSMSDIGMIQEAHIGVGIEGTTAASKSDVTIKNFSNLEELLLIHGHKQYIQISKMILLSFYAMAILEFYMAFYNIISA